MINVRVKMQEYRTTSGGIATIPDKDGKRIVLYFYPKDNTSGCTVEGLGFSEVFSELADLNTLIYGVSMDSLESHEEFKGEFDFPFELILDESGVLCKEFGVLNTVGDNVGVMRKTFIIGSGGEIEHQWDTVNVNNHAMDVLSVTKG